MTPDIDLDQCPATATPSHIRCIRAEGHTGNHRCGLLDWPESSTHRAFDACGCRYQPAAIHRSGCPDWRNNGPGLRDRHYVRRTPEPLAINALTGNLTGHEVERRVSVFVNGEDVTSRIVRDLVRTYAQMRDCGNRRSDELDAAATMIARVLVVTGSAGYTNQDVNRLMRKLEMAYRNGMWS